MPPPDRLLLPAALVAGCGRRLRGAIRPGRTVLLAAVLLAGCATYTSELDRGRRAYEQGEDDRALAVFRALEPDLGRLRRADRARYAYLRGMADYRLGYRADARYWLGLAAVAEKETPASLPPDWATTLNETLGDLDELVYRSGVAALDVAIPPPDSRSVIEAADESSGLFDAGAPSPAPRRGP